MAFSETLKNAVNDYCNNHLADESWYNEEFEFIEDAAIRKRLVEEFKGTRFAYKLYEGTHFMEEEYVYSMLAPMIRKIALEDNNDYICQSKLI